MPSGEKDIVFAVFIAALTLFILATLIVMLVYNYFRVKSQRQRDILKAVFEAQEAERGRISEDLHDDIGGKISALKLQNELLIAEGLTEQGAGLARRNSGAIDVIVKDIRRIVRNQASKYLHENGLSHELHALCNQYRSVSGLEIDLRMDETEPPLKPDFKVAVFRILQELLHNSLKHANATAIIIQLRHFQDKFEVFYSDNGKGFSVPAGQQEGMGLKNIRARAQLYYGEVEFESIPHKQTSCTLTFRLREVAA
jgi:signal transduction histidine kinase